MKTYRTRETVHYEQERRRRELEVGIYIVAAIIFVAWFLLRDVTYAELSKKLLQWMIGG